MRIFILIIILLSLGCSTVKKKVAQEELSQNIKINLVFEKEIKGSILGVSLSKPYGLAMDFQGDIFVTDAGNNRIVKFDSALHPIRQFGGFGSDEGHLNFPTYLTFDNGLNLMVSDEKNQRVVRFNSRLLYVDQILFSDEDDPLKFGYPSGISFTNYGETWIADRDNNQIAIFNNIGKYSHSLGQFGYSGGQLSSPEKIVRDKNNDFLVCDAGNNRIVRYDEYANYINEYVLDLFEYPQSLAIHDDKIFVLDSYSGSIFCLHKNGQFIGEIGAKLLGDKTKLLNPSDLLFISNDRILISDTGNDRLIIGKLIIDE